VVDSFAAGLQAGHDQRDADILNRQFAADVVWGSPYWALGEDVIVAHVARLALGDDGKPLAPTSDAGQPFSELAMYVLRRHDKTWWLAAGQNTPMRPGEALPATA
jgi:hypothetical protein